MLRLPGMEIGGGGKVDPELYKQKSKNISIVSSNKTMCDLHRFRIAVARACKMNGWADAMGTFDGNPYVNIEQSLYDYRYSIAIENIVSDYYFTQKITNCFLAQVIPIYYGANKIDEFFNPDGIIRITELDLNHIEKVLKSCTKEEYERRLPAILDNYSRVQKFANVQDWLYENYLYDKLK